MAPRTTTDPLEILLEMGIDLDNLSDEEDYLSALMEATNALTIKSASDPRIRILQKEILKVRKKRKAADPTFKSRKTKISANSFKKKTSSVKALPGTSKGGALAVKKTKISAENIKSNEDKNILESILKSVTNISDMLREQYKLEEKNAEKDRKSTEKTKRKLQESGLEKAFKGLAKTTQKVIAPIKSLLDKIFGFITAVLLARFLNKFIDWFSDPDNRSKIKSIIRFLGDNWPKLLSAYIIFGTGLGKFSRFIVKLLARGAVRLAAATAGLLARLFGSRALGKFSRFFGKRGKLISGGIEAVTTVIAFKALEDSFTKGLGPDESAGIDKDIPTKGYRGGGLVQPIFKFNGGGGVNLNLLAPTNNILGYEGGSYVENPGEVSGPGGIDKVPAMLTDGEFVMSRGAVQKYGVSQLEAMNASGGGTNVPKIMNGTVFAKNGGYMGDRERAPDRNLKPNLPEILAGFEGRSSKSDVYLVRAINELVKVIKLTLDRDRDNNSNSNNKSNNSPSVIDRIMSTGDAVAKKGSELVEAARPMIEAARPMIKAAPSTIDYGSLYLKSQFGGSGGAITEADLSKQTKDEYARAYEVAKSKMEKRKAGVESVIRQQQNILNTPGITKEQERNAKNTLRISRSRLDKYNAGQVDVQYADFQVDGKLSPTAAAAQKTMGAVWASDTGDGGFKIEKEPYDFPIVKDPISLMNWKKLSEEEKHAWLDKQDPNLSVRKKLDPRPPYKGSLGAWGKQDIAEAMYSLNPAAAPMITDVKIGGNMRPEAILDSILNAAESIPIIGQASSFSRGLAMNLMFGKTRNVIKGPIEGASSDSFFRKLFPKNTKKNTEDKKLTPAQLLNAQAYAKSKGKYFSSTDGKTYESYQAAVDAKKAKLSSNKPNVSIPAPPPRPAPKVVVANTGSGRDGSFGAGTSGKGRPSDDVNAVNPGNGSQAKFRILGIPIPFT